MSNPQRSKNQLLDDNVQQGISTAYGVRYRSMQTQTVQDWVMDEHPVALVYNGLSHAVMMVTPTELENFAVGFSLSEGIINHRNELYDLEIVQNPAGTEVKMNISARAFTELKSKKRSLAGRTGCGLCGIESLEQFDVELPMISHSYEPDWLQLIPSALEKLPSHQPMTQTTGGAHAAAWITSKGDLLAVFEDVGRHNALDKLLGYLTLNQHDIQNGFVLMTSRASYELVRKCAKLDIALLASISAPTSFAITLAERSGLGLVSFCRGDGFVVYQTTDSQSSF